MFGRENRSNKFDQLLLPIEKIEAPGPGSYSHYTQFNNKHKLAQSMRLSSSPKRASIDSRIPEAEPLQMKMPSQPSQQN